MLDRWGRARLELECKINEAGERAVTFIGQYVALERGQDGGDGAAAGSFHMESCDPSDA